MARPARRKAAQAGQRRLARAATAVARRIKSGTVNVNSSLMSAYVSSGGWKNSGVGRERGPDGLRIYQNLQIMNVAP